MTILDGQCKKDFGVFIKSLKREYHIYKNWNALTESCKNALFVEFFDSVDIKISIHFETFGNYYFNSMITKGHLTTNLRLNSENRNDAITEAIKHSNKHYNDNCRVVFSDFL
jgi:hypothetical protein